MVHPLVVFTSVSRNWLFMLFFSSQKAHCIPFLNGFKSVVEHMLHRTLEMRFFPDTLKIWIFMKVECISKICLQWNVRKTIKKKKKNVEKFRISQEKWIAYIKCFSQSSYISQQNLPSQCGVQTTTTNVSSLIFLKLHFFCFLFSLKKNLLKKMSKEKLAASYFLSQQENCLLQ